MKMNVKKQLQCPMKMNVKKGTTKSLARHVVCSHCRHFDHGVLDNVQERNTETNCNFHSLMVAYHEYLMVTQLSRLHILRSRSAPFGSSMGLSKTKTKHEPYGILRPRKPNGSKKSWAIAQLLLVQPSRILRLSARAPTAQQLWTSGEQP
jgi:hypothetical protein